MEILELYRRGELLARYPLAGRGIEIGRALGCDLSVDDAELSARHWLVMERAGTVVAFDVSGGKREPTGGRPLPPGALLPLGREHALRRVYELPLPSPVAEPKTERLSAMRLPVSRLFVVVGRGPEARRVRVGDRPLQLGRAQDNDLVLSDRAVSAHHARLDPCECGLVLRDLGARNGTFVNGVRVQTAVVAEGTQLRLGRTDLYVGARDGAGAAGPTMVAESSAMLSVLGDVRRIAQLPWPVLVIGESGTGKEGIALSLHSEGPRKAQRLVAINAGGLPREIVESELFGHEKGAFTGAAAPHKGVFEQAHGGTLFLDEIGELPLDLQSRLLRVLETGEVRRVGAERGVHVDVRLVCATHRDLRAMVSDGMFRQDLYYRLARLVIDVPALRSRPEDIGALCAHFLQEIATAVGVRELSEEAQTRLRAYTWPGNARELRNVLCAAAAGAGPRIEALDVERALARVGGAGALTLNAEALRRIVDDHQGNIAAAARKLGISRTTLRDRLRRAA